MKRVLSIWLPHLAIERWEKSRGRSRSQLDSAFEAPPDAAVVLTVEGTHGPVIHAVTRAAAERGARAGTRLTDARALDPGLVAHAADPHGDSVLVHKLARWAGRWSPLVEADGDGLRLDVSGVGHLFGGEDGLVGDVQRRFRQIGLTVRTAIAPTAAAAWALAHHAPCICDFDELEARLTPLHVSALRVDGDTIRTLERLGLKTIGALMNVPRLALARRFRGTQDVLGVLDRMLGRKPEPLTAVGADLPPRSDLHLEEPAIHCEAALHALDRLVPSLVRQLGELHLGARCLSLAGYRVDGSVAIASVATSIPTRDPKHLCRLLSDKAAALDPQFGFDAFALTADWTEQLDAAQNSLVEESSKNQELARLVDRLTVKLGPRAVRRPKLLQSHLPERASSWISAVGSLEEPKDASQCDSAGADCAARAAGGTRRPQRLLDRAEAIDVIYATPEGMPRRFVWRRMAHDVVRVEGPERIAPEWWRQHSSARLRDYYRVEDQRGRRYWIYREGLVGDGRGGVPAWFIHGLFG
jgi:protein ImuB